MYIYARLPYNCTILYKIKSFAGEETTRYLFSHSKQKYILCFTYSVIQIEQIGIVLAMIGLGVRNYLADVLADISALGNMSESSETPAFTFCAEQLKPLRQPVLNHSIVASNAVAVASWITLEQHWWICGGKEGSLTHRSSGRSIFAE